MTSANIEVNPDAHVDATLISCLSLESPKSFFLFAGAGSGKTSSLVKTLIEVRTNSGEYLRIRNRRVAVITYTKAASEEIKSRLGLDELFAVSTIHSFLWELIQPFQSDIREWVRLDTTASIVELEQALAKAKSTTTKTYQENQRKLSSKKKRLLAIDSFSKFLYNPNGENRGRDSLNHSEVVAMGSSFINDMPLMRSILVQKFPILLIDESQDTNKYLVDAFLKLEAEHYQHFSLGLFGDMMQRIYSDGKKDLAALIPSSWETPKKVMNYRCPKRVIRLINKIRVDRIEQQPKENQIEGFARLFLIQAGSADKQVIEHKIMSRMADICADPLWNNEQTDVKILALEHHMAASRMGFLSFYEPLQKVERYRTGLLDGTLPGLGLFLKRIIPILRAHRTGDEFAKAQVVKEACTLLDRKNLRVDQDRQGVFNKVNRGIDSILRLWDGGSDPLIIDVLNTVHATNLFEIAPVLEPLLGTTPALDATAANPDEDAKPDEELQAWNAAFANPFSMLERYEEYVSGNARFGTHQGVKGLEFDRVMVVIDDSEARGFLFSYEKLFGVKEPSANDIKNEQEGEDTGIDRTTRLFYVTCSRAMKSLAIVAYTENPRAIKQFALSKQWFSEDEIEVIS